MKSDSVSDPYLLTHLFTRISFVLFLCLHSNAGPCKNTNCHKYAHAFSHGVGVLVRATGNKSLCSACMFCGVHTTLTRTPNRNSTRQSLNPKKPKQVRTCLPLISLFTNLPSQTHILKSFFTISSPAFLKSVAAEGWTRKGMHGRSNLLLRFVSTFGHAEDQNKSTMFIVYYVYPLVL